MLKRRSKSERTAAELARLLVALDELAAAARTRPVRRAARVSLRSG